MYMYVYVCIYMYTDEYQDFLSTGTHALTFCIKSVRIVGGVESKVCSRPCSVIGCAIECVLSVL